MNTFIQQGCIKLIKSGSKDIYNVTKDFYFKYMLINFLFIKKINHVIYNQCILIYSNRKSILNCSNVSQFYSVSDQNKCSLGEHKRFLSKTLKGWLIAISLF